MKPSILVFLCICSFVVMEVCVLVFAYVAWEFRPVVGSDWIDYAGVSLVLFGGTVVNAFLNAKGFVSLRKGDYTCR